MEKSNFQGYHIICTCTYMYSFQPKIKNLPKIQKVGPFTEEINRTDPEDTQRIYLLDIDLESIVSNILN